ncbi:hypothetical protein N7489_005074, partial [Penicillium chrysogenum]
FKVTDVEWRRIDYLAHLTKPFFRFTMALMRTKSVTIHSVFLVYRKLLEHIERSNQKLKKKTTPWKKDMYTALLAARQKLKEYYEKTYRDHGFLYGTGYSTCHEETSKRYCECLRTCFTQYQQQNPELLLRTVHRASALQSSGLDRLLEPVDDFMLHEGTEHDEVDQYLREVRETSAIIVEDLFMKRLSKIDDVHVLREIHPGARVKEALEEDEALRANEEDAAPISDDEEVEETEDVESNIEPEASYQAEGILAGTQQPSMHNQIIQEVLSLLSMR